MHILYCFTEGRTFPEDKTLAAASGVGRIHKLSSEDVSEIYFYIFGGLHNGRKFAGPAAAAGHV